MTPAQAVIARVAFFEKLYDAFYGYFVTKLSKDDSKYAKYHIQMQARFVDDLDLQKVVLPVYAEFSSNVEEKRAVAQAALYDALVAHTFSRFLGDTAAQVNARMDALEGETARAVGLLHTLVNQEVGKVRTELGDHVGLFHTKPEEIKEPVNAIPEGKQIRVGKKARVQE